MINYWATFQSNVPSDQLLLDEDANDWTDQIGMLSIYGTKYNKDS